MQDWTDDTTPHTLNWYVSNSNILPNPPVMNNIDYIVLFRKQVLDNGVLVDGTCVCMVEIEDNNDGHPAPKVVGDPPFYYARFVNPTGNWAWFINIINKNNISLTSLFGAKNDIEGDGVLSYYLWYPDSVIDFRDFISKINS